MTQWLYVGAAQLVNASVGFVLALAWALACALLAPQHGLKKALLCLPFVKVLGDLIAGVPAAAYVNGPFVGQRWELGSFQLGLSVQQPFLVPSFVGRMRALKSEEWFDLSAGDGVSHFFAARGFEWVLVIGVGVVTAVAALKVGWRIRAWVSHFRRDSAARKHAIPLGYEMLGRRRVELLKRDDDGPTVVTGVWRPCVWVSRRLRAAPPDVQSAAIEHELSHVRQWDVLLFALLGLCRDALWFLPGSALLERRIRAWAELGADAGAVRRGASPLALAEAIYCEGQGPSLAPALGGGTSSIRVRRLLHPSVAPRGVRLYAALATYLGIGLMLSKFCGYN